MGGRKKLIITGLLAGVLLVGSIGGAALAQTGSTDNTTSGKSLLGRVATILGIEQQTLEDAFAQARSEMRDEALDNYLQKLVNEGKITQEQADQYKAWWQSRPDIEPFRQQMREWQQARPSLPDEFKEWHEARPDLPFPGGFGRSGEHGIRGGMMRGRGMLRNKT